MKYQAPKTDVQPIALQSILMTSPVPRDASELGQMTNKHYEID